MKVGDRLFVGPRSKAQIRLKNGSEITIEENSLVVISGDENALTLDLQFGSAQANLTDLANPKIEIAGKPLPVSSRGKVELTTRAKTKITAANSLRPPPKFNDLVWIKPLDSEVFQFLRAQGANSSLNTPSIPLQWADSKSAKMYELEFRDLEEKRPPIILQSATGTELIWKPKEPGRYTARVRRSQEALWSKEKIIFVEEKVLNQLGSVELIQTPEPLVNTFKPLKYVWRPVNLADSYEVEWRANPSSPQAEKTEKVLATELNLTPTRPGSWVGRIRATSQAGLTGPWTDFPTTQVQLRPPQIARSQPIEKWGENAQSLPEKVQAPVRWSEVPFAKKYQIEISPDPSFSTRRSFESAQSSTSVELAEPGRQFVRVRPLGADGQPLTAYSNPEVLTYSFRLPEPKPQSDELLKSASAPPQLLETEFTSPRTQSTLFFQTEKNHSFWLEWKKIDHAKNYQIQASRSKDFTTVLLDVKTSQTRYLIQQPKLSGKIYWRVRSLGDQETQSAWSATHNLWFASGRRPAAQNP